MRRHIVGVLRIGLVFPVAAMVSGCTNVLAFTTATKFGLDISQRADQTVDVTMGYDRAEIASIPVPKKDDLTDADATSDAYSVLGTFWVRYDTPWGKEPLELDQFFATGMAARQAAVSPELGKVFGRKAGCIAGKSNGTADKTICPDDNAGNASSAGAR